MMLRVKRSARVEIAVWDLTRRGRQNRLPNIRTAHLDIIDEAHAPEVTQKRTFGTLYLGAIMWERWVGETHFDGNWK